jgi:hypothetical protein
VGAPCSAGACDKVRSKKVHFFQIVPIDGSFCVGCWCCGVVVRSDVRIGDCVHRSIGWCVVEVWNMKRFGVKFTVNESCMVCCGGVAIACVITEQYNLSFDGRASVAYRRAVYRTVLCIAIGWFRSGE